MEILQKVFEMYVGGFRKFADFKSRSGKFEFWSFALLNTVVSHIFGFVGKLNLVLTLLAVVYGFAVLVPLAAMFVRRVRDTGHSPYWVAGAFSGAIYPLVQQFLPFPFLVTGVLNLMCFLALIYVLILTVCPSSEKNKYGQPPAENKQEIIVANIFVTIFFALMVWQTATVVRTGTVLTDTDKPANLQVLHHTTR